MRKTLDCFNCITFDGKTAECKKGHKIANRNTIPNVKEVTKGRLYIGCASCKYFDGG